MATSRRPSPSALICTPVRIGRVSSVLAATVTWRSASSNAAAGSTTASSPGSREARELGGGDGAHGELRPTRGDVGVFALERDLDLARRQRACDLPDQLGRDHRGPVAIARDRLLDLDGGVEVAAGQAELVTGELEADPAEHGQGAAPAGDRTAGSRDRLDQLISLASELHVVARFPSRKDASSRSRSDKACGLWRSRCRRWSEPTRLFAGRPHPPTGWHGSPRCRGIRRRSSTGPRAPAHRSSTGLSRASCVEVIRRSGWSGSAR